MQKKYKNHILGPVVLFSALLEISGGLDNKVEQKTMIMDKFLTDDINISHEDVSFDDNVSSNPEIIGEYSLLNKTYSQPQNTSNATNQEAIISNEKIADPAQRYRDVDLYLYTNKQTNIHKEDNVNSEIVKTAEYGDYIHKIGNDPYNNDGFSKIEIEGQPYYMETQSLTTEVLFKERNQTVYAKEDLKIYDSMELKNEIGSLSYIKGITMIGESQFLIKVSINDTVGYIDKSKISKEMLFINNEKKVWTLCDLNLKKSPSSDAETVKTIYKYDSLQQLGTSESWSKLKTANGTIVYAKTENFTDVRPITLGEEIARYAQQFVGNPYVYGGTSLTNGADCSGFVQTIYKHFGYSLNRTASSQMSNGRAIPYSSARPGDLIFYSGHVAMYIGNGQIVHASNSAPYPRGGIKISSATYNTIIGVRRIVD